MAGEGSKKVVYSALGANAGIAAAKFGVGVLTGSVAMLAEAAHPVAGAFFSLYEGAKKLLEGGAHHGPLWPSYLVLVLAFLFDGGVLIVALR